MTQTGTLAEEATIITWKARGFTDDVTTCEHCGRVDLKGTVRMEATTTDNESEGETYMGVVCAARMTGRKAGEIRTEASRADRERTEAVRAAWSAWSDLHSSWVVATTKNAVGAISRDVKPANWMDYQSTDAFKTAEAAWTATNPAPVRPW